MDLGVYRAVLEPIPMNAEGQPQCSYINEIFSLLHSKKSQNLSFVLVFTFLFLILALRWQTDIPMFDDLSSSW